MHPHFISRRSSPPQTKRSPEVFAWGMPIVLIQVRIQLGDCIMDLHRLREILTNKKCYPNIDGHREEMRQIVEGLPWPVAITGRYLQLLTNHQAAAPSRIQALFLNRQELAALAK